MMLRPRLHASGWRRSRAWWRVASVLLLVLISCSPDAPPDWNDEGSHRWRSLSVPRRGATGFTSVSPRRTGVDFQNRLSGQAAMERDHLLVGSGVAIGDYDGDGLPDLYFARLEGDNALFRNQGDWRFEDVTGSARLTAPARYSTGAAFADVDGDGDLDLFVTALGGPDALYMNDGKGGFDDVTEMSGLESRLGSTTATFADVDGDGDLDLYVTRYKVESAADVLRPYEQASVELVVERHGRPVIGDAYQDHFRLEMRDGRQVAVEQADPDRLYLNDGGGRFEPASWTGGRFLEADRTPLTREPDDFGLSARFYDVDGDGDPDLYVCSDFDDPDHFWLNDGSGTFRRAPAFALRTQSHASMAVDFSDIDRDGDVDFFVADMLSPDPGRRLVQVPLHAALTKPAGRIADRPQAARNTLFVSRGDGTWAQAAEMAGVDATEWTWGSLFLDVDLDGFEDLLVANGHGRDMRDGDTLDGILGLRGLVTWSEAKSLYPDLPTKNFAFRNRGDLTFEDTGGAWGFGEEADVSHGMAVGDLDGDGDLDLVVNRLNAPAALLRNDGTAARVAVRLIGIAPNTRGIGARVRLVDGAVPIQEKEVTAGGLYLSGSDAQVTFAAGAAPAELAIEVSWRSGRTTRVTAVRPNRLYELREDGAGAAADSAGATEGPTPLFVDVSASVGHTHAEDAFDDLLRQPLLPYQLSRLGPGITWADLDDDGDPDLIVPGGKGGRAATFRNDGDLRFTPLGGVPGEHDQTTVLPSWSERGVTLLVGQTSYDAQTPDEARAVPGVARAAWGVAAESQAVAAPHLSSVGPLAQADVDGDGDLDLFVGGRTVPAFYPLPATSRLLLNEGGVLRDVTQNGDTLFRDLGLVSGAVFTDVDDDGDPDLVLAIEWGPPTLFLNDGGRFLDGTEAWGLSELSGLWKGVGAGDLDGDGRMDLVVTNEGRNTRLATSAERRLTLVHGDVDRNGVWDILLSRARKPGGPLHPLVRYESVRAAIPVVRARVTSFESYGEVPLSDVLGVEPASLFQLEVSTLEHLALLNRGGRFEPVSLPVEAQLAPAHHAGVADLDGDGREDVFMTQNFFPTDGFTPRYDAGRSLLLRGDGSGRLQAVPGRESGLLVYGDQRGAAFADVDLDGRLDLAVAQNGAATKLYRNVGARPGLRVRLVGPSSNPAGIGARLRVRYAGRLGPAREIRSGSGYWSSDDAVQILGLEDEPTALLVRWPGGGETEVPVAAGTRNLVVRAPPP